MGDPLRILLATDLLHYIEHEEMGCAVSPEGARAILEIVKKALTALEAERDALKHIVREIYHFAERCPVCGQSKNVREGDELMPSGRKHLENCKLVGFLEH